MKTAMTMTLLLCLLLQACSMTDERDVCCGANTVRFRYWYRNRDRFREYISMTRYFLFSGDGTFLREMKEMPQKTGSVDISALAPGGYTLVAVGNLRECGTLDLDSRNLEGFRLLLDREEGYGDLVAPCDRLYWGERAFTVKEGETNSFIGEMSNIHCVLRVTVQWEMEPDHAEGYSLQLGGVPREVSMNAVDSYVIDVHRFPATGPYAYNLRQPEILNGREIASTLVTLRWTAAEMPVLTLLNCDRPVTKEIDLGWVFRAWRWNPQRDDVQDYGIRLRIRRDRTIEIYQGSDMSVSDWIDGGYLG